MGRMHVAHFEAGALAGQAARPERGHAALVRHFRQRIVLIHELGQLRGAEELLHRRRHRLGVDQILRGQAIGLGQRQALAHRTLHAHQADAEGVLGHFADRTHATVAEVIDVIDGAMTVLDVDQHLQHVEDVGGFALLLDQRSATASSLRSLKYLWSYSTPGPRISLRPTRRLNFIRPTRRQVVAIEGEEQVVEQVLRGILGRRLARTHHAIDFHQRLERRLGVVDAQGMRDVGAAIEVVDVQRRHDFDTGLAEVLQLLGGDLVVGRSQQLAGLAVDDVGGQDAADRVIVRHFQRGDVLGGRAGARDAP